MRPTMSGRATGWPRSGSTRPTSSMRRMACELAVAGKKLVAARARRRGLAEAGRPGIARGPGGVEGGGRRACGRPRSWRPAPARLERTDPPAARELYRKSLEIAADLPDAVAGLSRCPPDAPTASRSRPLGDRIRLSWTPPPPDGLGPLTFAVMRKRGGLPQHPGDGTRIAEVSTCEFEDRRVRPGETVSYAVLAKRGEAESLAAVAAGPVVFLPDVQDVRVEPREGVVELSWIPPHGAFEVRVDPQARGTAVGSPRRRSDRGGARPGPRHATCSDDQVYHYGIYAIYRQPDGRRFPSPGVVVAAIPRSPLAPLESSPADALPGWTGPTRLDRAVPGLGPDPPHAAAAALRAGHPAHARPGRAARRGLDPDPGPGSRRGHRTPRRRALLLHAAPGHGGQLDGRSRQPPCRAWPIRPISARPGSGRREAMAPAVLASSSAGDGLPEAARTRMVIRQGSPPTGPDDPEAIVVNVAREEYDRAGAWTMSLPRSELDEPSDFELEPSADAGAVPLPSTRWHATAYQRGGHRGRPARSPRAWSPPRRSRFPAHTPRSPMSYALKRPWLPGRPWSLVVHTEPPGAAIPPHGPGRQLPGDSPVGRRRRRRRPLARVEGRGRPPDPDAASISPDRASVHSSTRPPSRARSPPIRIRHPESGLARV